MIEKTSMNIPGIGAAGSSNAAKTVGNTTGGSFADMLKDVADESLKTSHGAETQSLKAAAKDAEIVDVITAVANAEITLNTVMTVRDRVVHAYQEIMKMPI